VESLSHYRSREYRDEGEGQVLGMTRSQRSARITVTLACFLMATFAWGTVFYGHSVYMDALTRDRGWSTALVSTAILTFWLASLPGTMSVGFLIDRRGPVPVVIIGALCIGLGLIALGHVSQPWQLFAVYIVLGFGYPAMAAAAISPTLAPWFDKGFGAALGVALSGASVGGALVPVLLVYSSERHGFEVTMLMMGGTVLAVLALVAIVLARLGRPEPASAGEPAPTPIRTRERLRDPLFWRIAVAAALGLGGQVGLLAHQIPIVSVHGTPELAAAAVTIVAVGSAVGRLVVAQASRVVPVTVLAALSYGTFGVGVAVIALSQSLTQVYIGCAIAGFVVGPIVLLPPVLVRQAFGSSGYGGTYALVNVVMYVLAALGPWMVGLLYAYWGDYTGGLWMLVLLEICAIALILKPLPKKRLEPIASIGR
jgi:MFS family permease